MQLDQIGSFQVEGFGVQPQFSHQPQPTPQNQNPPQPQPEPKPPGGSSPLDKFAFLKDNANNQNPPVDKDGKPIQQAKPINVFELDSKQLTEVAGKADFTSIVPEATIKSILGANATKEQITNLQAVFNSFGQTVLAQSLNANHTLAKTGVNQSLDTAKTQMLNEISLGAAKDLLLKDLPQLNNAVHLPNLENTMNRIQVAKPGISVVDLHSLTLEYYKTIGIEPNKQESKTSSGIRPISNFFADINKS
jgi:hypothetical protein